MDLVNICKDVAAKCETSEDHEGINECNTPDLNALVKKVSTVDSCKFKLMSKRGLLRKYLAEYPPPLALQKNTT